MASEVAELIRALRDGRMTLDQVEQRFRERHWPQRNSAEPGSYLEMAARAQEDPDPDVPDSFDDVVAAYDRGEITRQQYRILAQAVADSIRAEGDSR